MENIWPLAATIGSLLSAGACAYAAVRAAAQPRVPWLLLAVSLLVFAMVPLMQSPAAATISPGGPRTAILVLQGLSAILMAAGFYGLGHWARARGKRIPAAAAALQATDVIILFGSLSAVGWCVLPRAITSTSATFAVLFPVVAMALVLAAASLSRTGTGHRGQAAWLIFESGLAGAALLWAEAIRRETTTEPLHRVAFTSANPADFIFAIIAPLMLGLAAILAARPAGSAAMTEAGSPGIEHLEGGERSLNFGLRRVELAALVVLPCAALLLTVGRVLSGTAPAKLTPLVTAFAALALIRQSAVLWTQVHRTVEFEGAAASDASALRTQLARRTHQLTTLHAVTADLNNTLDVERLISTALESVCQAVEASSAAIWLRLDDANLAGASPTARRSSGVGSPEMKPVGSAAVLLRELERSASERRAIERLQSGDDGTDDNHIIVPAVQWVGRRWRMVHTRGTNTELLQTMHDALELGDLTAAAEACRSRPPLAGAGHIAAVRWKGEIIGALGVLCPHAETGPSVWDEAERTLVDALALEVGAALRNAQLYQEASRQVDRDSLTDLLNHRALQGQLGAHLSRAQRTKMDFSVVLMDVKNFKFFNDTYGHHIGDQVLRTVARCLTEATRESDVVGRFGGDEFMAILLDTDSRGTIEVCSRIKERVEREAFQESNDGRRIPIALSFGAAMFPVDGKTVMELITGAQTQLETATFSDGPMLGNLQKSASEEALEMRKLREAGEGGSFGVLDALVTAIDNKDHYTRRHSEDVTQWATSMAKQLEFPEETQRAVRIAGLLHDVGKIAVPDAILRKPGRLNDEEFQIMQQHPVFGALIVKEVPHLTEVLGGIRHHHERYDGKGYPDKLAGTAIPALGRLLAVPDCFSAMTTERPYRKAMSWAEAIAEIEKGRGTQFDPVMADAFLEVIARMIAEKAAPAPHATPEREAYTNLRPRSIADMETAVR